MVDLSLDTLEFATINIIPIKIIMSQMLWIRSGGMYH